MSVLTVTFPSTKDLHPIVSCRSPLHRLHEKVKKVFTERIHQTYPIYDLLERVFVVIFAALTYVVHLVISIPYWLDSTMTFPVITQTSHSHHSCNDKGLELSAEAIRQISDPSKLREEDSIYPMEKLSDEQQMIANKMKDPQLGELIQYIRTTEGEQRKNAFSALFVVLGIKPIRVYERNISADPKLLSILRNFPERTGVLLHEDPHRGHHYFINRSPLQCFNPYSYIPLDRGYPLSYHISVTFPEQGNEYVDQLISYFLGYGPSWEAFAMNQPYAQDGKIKSCLFEKKHYIEIGQVLFRQFFGSEASAAQAEVLGRAYHSQFASIHSQYAYIQTTILRSKTDAVSKLLEATGTAFFFDGITARTDYFRKSYTLKKWVMQTYFSSISLA